MKLHHRQSLALAFLAPLLFVAEAANSAGQKILLSQVSTLTLRSGQMTKGRRLGPISQLSCVGGDGQGLYEIDVMRCHNSGSDYGDENIIWKCTAELPKYFKLGSTDVLCEGYNNPEDEHILKGSCGVEYRLALTDAGYEKYGTSLSRLNKKIGYTAYIFWPIFLSILGWILFSAFTRRTPNGRPRSSGGTRRPWFGGGGGGGDSPPPPYTRGPSSSNQEQWRPGFWSGLTAALVGSYFMNRSNRQEREQARTSSSRFSGGSGSSPGWGSGSSSSDWRTAHRSTGFGQTIRR
ncbi:hypothetical protein RUND412_002767 [Rhizina undulata]